MSPAALLALISLSEAQHGIPKGLLASICIVESELNPHAVVERDGKSGRTSYGMCQIQLRTARQFRPSISASQLLVPSTNAHLAGAYLKWNYKRYHSWVGATIGYNSGHWNGGLTNQYIRKVAKEWKNGRSKSITAGPNSRHPKRNKNARTGDQRIQYSYTYSN